MTTDNRILERIKKLMALANDAGASEGEVDNAMRMAHRLLAKHNLTMAEVSKGTEAIQEEDLVFKNKPWVRRTINSIAYLYFCSYLVNTRDRRSQTRHTFIGKESNVQTARYIAEFVIKTINRQARKERRLLGKGSSYETSFCNGASWRIVQRVHNMKEETENEGLSSGTDLVVADLYEQAQSENMSYIRKNHITTELKPRKDRSTDATAYNRGSQHASSISLSPQIGGHTSNPKLTK